MTIKQITTIFLFLAFTIMIASGLIFNEYRSTNERLNNIDDLLKKVSATAHEIELEILNTPPDNEAIKQSIATIPEITRQLQEELLSGYKPDKIVDIEVMFVRIRRVIDQSLPGHTFEPALQEQIRHETFRIARTVEALQPLARQKINTLRTRAEAMLLVVYLGLFAYVLAILYFLSKMVVRPILKLSRQIAEVRQGTREEITPSSRNDEIGRLNEFARQTFSELARNNAGLQQEIKERKQVEEKLRHSTTTLENVLHNSNPICITNLNFEIVQANKAYYEFWPKGGADHHRIKCYDSRPGGHCHTNECPLRQILQGEDKVTVESIKTEENGEQYHFIITARAFKDDEGKLAGIVESFQNITERKLAETSLRQERDKLQTALSEVKTLQGLIPICCSCKNIRDDKGYWNHLEEYIGDRSDAEFSHGLCPECAEKLYPDLYDKVMKKKDYHK